MPPLFFCIFAVINAKMMGKRKCHFCIENPFKTWWKVRKYFKLPNISLHFFGHIYKNCPYANFKNAASVLDIWCNDVYIEDRHGYPSHVRSPFIWVCFFGKFGFSINFNVWYTNHKGWKTSGDSYYWEYIDSILHYGKTLNDVECWTSKDFNTGKRIPVPTPFFSLNKRGLSMLTEETLSYFKEK